MPYPAVNTFEEACDVIDQMGILPLTSFIPLPATEIQRIRDTIATYQFERLYGAWFERVVAHNAHEVVLRSADRYIRALQTVLHSTQ